MIDDATARHVGRHVWPLVGYSVVWFVVGFPVAFTGLLLFWVGRNALTVWGLVGVRYEG